MMDYYRLDDENNAVHCSLKEWSGNDRRKVAKDIIDGYQISTMFLGLDHSYDDSKPLLFETMIFGEGPGDQYQTRCSTWKEAEEMHKKAIQWVKNGCKDE